MTTTTEPRTKFDISSEESARVRNSSTKTGYLLLVEFHPRFSRRGMRRIVPVRTAVRTTSTEAMRRDAAGLQDRYRDGIRSVTLYLIDHMGRVRGTTPVAREDYAL